MDGQESRLEDEKVTQFYNSIMTHDHSCKI